MATGVAQLTNMTTGHGCWPPTMIAQACGTVIVESLPAATIGHMAIPHVCTVIPFPVHPLSIAQGSSNIIAEGAPLARMGDMMSCSDMIAQSAATVIGGG